MKLSRWILCAIVAPMIGTVGCQAPASEMADMQMPARPAELDRLTMFVGHWKGTMKMKMGGSDETIESTGTSNSQWGLDKHSLIDHFEADMGNGQTMKGLGIWVWDPKAKKYRSHWFDNWGGVGEGSVTYNEKTRVWHYKARSVNAYLGTETVGEGTMTFPDNDTMEWIWTEWAPWTFRLVKVVEMEGTSSRQ